MNQKYQEPDVDVGDVLWSDGLVRIVNTSIPPIMKASANDHRYDARLTRIVSRASSEAQREETGLETYLKHEYAMVLPASKERAVTDVLTGELGFERTRVLAQSPASDDVHDPQVTYRFEERGHRLDINAYFVPDAVFAIPDADDRTA